MTVIAKPLSLALLSLAVSAASAAPSASPVPARVEVLSTRSHLDAARTVLGLREFDTAYLMSTGRRLDVRTAGDSLRVRYGRHTAATLVHDGQGRFISGDGQLALRFELDADGDPQLVRMSLPADWQ